MKRTVCARNAHRTKIGKSVTIVSEEDCSFNKHAARPRNLKDIARDLEAVAEAMRVAYEYPDHDPFGFTFHDPFVKVIKDYLKNVNEPFKERMLHEISKEVIK